MVTEWSADPRPSKIYKQGNEAICKTASWSSIAAHCKLFGLYIWNDVSQIWSWVDVTGRRVFFFLPSDCRAVLPQFIIFHYISGKGQWEKPCVSKSAVEEILNVPSKHTNTVQENTPCAVEQTPLILMLQSCCWPIFFIVPILGEAFIDVSKFKMHTPLILWWNFRWQKQATVEVLIIDAFCSCGAPFYQLSEHPPVKLLWNPLRWVTNA